MKIGDAVKLYTGFGDPQAGVVVAIPKRGMVRVEVGSAVWLVPADGSVSSIGAKLVTPEMEVELAAQAARTGRERALRDAASQVYQVVSLRASGWSDSQIQQVDEALASILQFCQGAA